MVAILFQSLTGDKKPEMWSTSLANYIAMGTVVIPARPFIGDTNEEVGQSLGWL